MGNQAKARRKKRKQAKSRKTVSKNLSLVDESRGWIPVIHEPTLGAFQRNEPVVLSNALSHPTVYACISQIAYDIGKLRLNLTKKDNNDIATVTQHSTITPLLRRPNHFQTRQKFIELWLTSLLTYGNTYTLKARNTNGTVVALYILDPTKIEPLVSEDGAIFYRLKKDRLTQVPKDIIAIPAYEIIHDTMITLFHPLIGVSPLYAASRTINQSLAIQEHSEYFFENRAQPGGILTAPGHIKKDTADAIRAAWATRYSGENAGKIAVLGDGLKYDSMSENAEDSQLVEQLQWSDEKICSVFKVPPYKVYVGKQPTYEQSESLDRAYYSGCLQRHIESIESLLDEGLSVPANQGTQFVIEDLLKMDIALKMRTQAEGVKGGFIAPNEARRKFNYSPVQGGDTPYMQQQNFSLAALDERDKTNPLAVSDPEPAISAVDEAEEAEGQKWIMSLQLKDNLIEVAK